jgi:hypothetical protein
MKYIALSFCLTAAQNYSSAFVNPINNCHDALLTDRTCRFSTTAGDVDVVEETTSETSTTTTTTTTPYSTTAQVFGEPCEAGGTLLTEILMTQKQNFPVEPQTLVAKAKFALGKDSGVRDPNLWSDDFEFVAPYVGPLSKEEFLQAANGFDIYEAFPDFDNRYFGFTVDPLEPGRVWFFTRLKATNTGKLFGQAPTGKTVELPPQVFSFKFNEQGLIREMTVGYAVDRRQGDTGGLGGMFGLFYGIGKPLPFPEGKPYELSKRYRLFQKVSGLITKFTKKK